jgi:cysteine desulfurase
MTAKMFVQFDANASYGLLSGVKEELFNQNLTNNLFNPSSIHQAGQRARAIIEDTREKIRTLCGFKNSKYHNRARIVLSSGATESNNQALETLCAGSVLGTVLITSTVEHPSVIEKAKELIKRGVEVHFVTPALNGCWPRDIVNAHVQSAVTSGKKVAVSLMHANNEIGVIYDTPELFTELHHNHPAILLHSDCVQTFGKISVSSLATVADMITISGHKVGALQGVGALVAKPGFTPEPILFGGPQESRLRAGTENVLGIYSLGVVLEQISINGLLYDGLGNKRAFVINKIKEYLPSIEINGEGAEQFLANTVNIYIPGLRGEDAVVALDLMGVLVSYGSACASGKQEVSHVLKAMGFSDERAKSSIRCSFRHDLTEDEIVYAVSCLARVSSSVRSHGVS